MPAKATVKKTAAATRPAMSSPSLSLFGNKGLTIKEKQSLFSDLGILISAGVDLQSVFTIITQNNTKNAKLLKTAEELERKITNGISLHEAMEAAGSFSKFDYYSVSIGENTGSLDKVFSKLAEYYTKRIDQRRKIMSSLSYPIIILFTTMAAITFMLKFVVPMFSETLTRFGGELPGLTRNIIYLSDHLSLYLFIFTGIVAAIAGLYYANRKNERMIRAGSSALLKIPIAGKVVRKIYLVQFSQAMSLLLNAHVGILESIQLTKNMISFYPLSSSLGRIEHKIVQGESFHSSLHGEPFFDSSMTILVRIGEEVNQLEKIFTNLSAKYEQEFEHETSVLIKALEPILILVLSVIVGVVLIAMYLPMFKIGTTIH